ncbi:hypothetical protein [Paenibacillus gansuensis]|uniref:Type II secretion system protein GspF domain-containing protein n=1 Tax=Paenibacillus gansuensis TaxID=306542 RepID=A0ABW5PID2_9BACL
MQWLLAVLFGAGCVLLCSSLLFLFPARRRVRIPFLLLKRRENLREWAEKRIQHINNRPANLAVKQRLKMAGDPLDLTVFRYRVLQYVFPVLLLFLYVSIRSMQALVQRTPVETPHWSGILLAGLLGAVLPPVMLLLLAVRRRDLMTGEIVKFSHRLVVSINEHIQLYYAIKRAGRTCHILKPYIDELLMDWLSHPQQGIRKFAERVGVPEVLPITNTLLATWNAPSDKILELFHHQIRNIDTMRDFQVKKSIEVSPLHVTFLIVIPFMFTVGLMLLPWYMEAIALMNKAF